MAQGQKFDPETAMRDAALARLARRQMEDGGKGTEKSGKGAMLGGIVGAILGASAGNPMMGYALGSQLGSAAGKGQLDTETVMGLAPSILRSLTAPKA
jgi:uncharacterized membrane protein